MNGSTTLAQYLAAALGETDPGRRDRLDRLVRTLGEARALALLARAEVLLAGGDERLPSALGATPLAGVFFRLVHEEVRPAERARIFAAEADPVVRARVSPVPGSGDPTPAGRPVVPLSARRRNGGRIGCLIFVALVVLLLGVVEHALLAAKISLGCWSCAESASPHYGSMTWPVWWGTLAAIAGCAIAGAIVRSGWRWVLWGGVLVLPIAWLVLVDAAFKSTGESPGEGTGGVTEHWRGITPDTGGFNGFYGEVQSAPAVTGQTVYATTSDGGLYALDRATGATQWTFAAGEWVTASPVVAGGIVYVARFDTAGGGGLDAVDARTGTRLWWFPTGAEAKSAPATGNGLVYLGSWDGILVALDASSGTPRWRLDLGSPINASPVLAGDTVYVATMGGQVAAVDAATGQQRWTATAGGQISASPVAAGGTVYAIADGDALYALAAATGEREWRLGLGSPGDAAKHGFVSYGLSVADGVAYVSGGDNLLRAIDLTTRTERWRFSVGIIALDAMSVAAPTVAHGVVYVGSRDYRLYAVDGRTGTERWHVTTGEVIRGAAVVEDGVVYVGSDDGHVYAIDEPSPPASATPAA